MCIRDSAGTDYQTVLPGGNNGPSTEGTFNPGTSNIAFYVNGTDGTDPTVTAAASLANDVRHGCNTSTSQCGHHVRMYPVKASAGVVIPNLWLMVVDSNGTNLDFNDGVYLVNNITPA